MDGLQESVRDMSREEVMALFERYDFRDEQGHPLTNCQDFLSLVEMAMEVKAGTPESNTCEG